MPWDSYRTTGLILVSLTLLSCDKPPPAEPVDNVRPVKTYLIGATDSRGMRSFPARIDAGRKAELSFRVPGKVTELSVKEGDDVEKGQQVAVLDSTDYQIAYNDRKASYDNAKKNFSRARELVDKGNISKMDYDRLEAEFKSAGAALESAQQDLNYTKLSAPFKGVIAKRHIENFEEVQAKQTILDLQDITQLEVKFDVPESQVRELRPEEDKDAPKRTNVPVRVTFSDLPGKSYPLTFREISTKADAKTQTFQVTYTMERTGDVTILPGMTANAIVDLSAYLGKGAHHTVPIQAIVGDFKLAPKAWVIDEQSMIVKSRSVKVGRLTGNRIEVLEGLQSGERVVTAGASFLVENMKVRLMPDREQAEPRSDDLKYQ